MPGPGKPAIISLTTDFGQDDSYVGVVKGVILRINPQATIVDLCHSVPPRDVAGAAFILGVSYPYFPDDTIHLVVVDPGVGSDRPSIIVRTDRADRSPALPAAFFVGPDNGVLSAVLLESGWDASGAPGQDSAVVVNITSTHYCLPNVSATFHARDIFAPVAAHLSLGVPMDQFGGPAKRVHITPVPQPELGADGSVVGHVLHIDRFGNLITDIRAGHLPATGDRLTVAVRGQLIQGLSPCYAAGSGLMALVSSGDSLEIAVANGSAAHLTGAKRGDRVTVRRMGAR